MTDAAPAGRSRVRRHPERGRYDRETLDEVLDEALICHLGFVARGRPVVIPTIHARVGDVVYIHGSTASRMTRSLAAGVDVCLTASIVDGIVLARSAFSSSMNYRSACVFGRADEVTEADERELAYEAIVEHVAPGRWDDCRHPSAKEAAATTVLRLPIAEFSCKVRSGPPVEGSEDIDLPHWAGVLPLAIVAGTAQDSPNLLEGRSLPPYVAGYSR